MRTFPGFILTVVLVAVLAVCAVRYLKGIASPTPGSVTVNYTLSESDLRSDAQVKLLSTEATQLLVEIKQICDAQHLKFIGSTDFKPTQGRVFEFEWEDNLGPRIELSSDEVSFQFWKSSNRLASYFNRKLEPLLDGKNAPHFDQPDKAAWNDTQAIQIGSTFLRVLDVPAGTSLGSPNAKFQTQMDLPKYLLGQWIIRWNREDTEGHPFTCDTGAMMYLPEGYGPESLSVGLNVPYLEQKGPRLSQADGVSKAREKIVSARSGLAPSLTMIPTDKSIVADKLMSGELAIVEVARNRSWSLWGSQPVHTARLAWVFWFDPVFEKPIQGPTYNHQFMVSVDAYTGDIVGTNAML